MSVVSSKQVITRKPHACWGCAITYPEKTSMNAVNWVDGGKIETSYWCATCQEIWNRYMQHGDEVGFGELRGGDQAEWEKIKCELEVKGNERN